MKLKLIILTVIIFLVNPVIGQNAKDILEKASNAYSASSGYVLSFTLNTEDVGAKTTYSHDGKAYIKGNKFKIEVPDGVTWFDGKTQWVYLYGSDEVNVSNPTGEELASISPVALLGMYKSGFNLNNKGTKTENGKTVYMIEMVPQKKGSEIIKIKLKIDKATHLFTEIYLEGTNKVNNRLIIKKNEKATGLNDSFFVFNRNDYPGVEVIDLR